MTTNVLRHVFLTPYRPGQGPTFRLTMKDTNRRDHRGQTIIAYCLRMREGDRKALALFEGEDFAGSPMHADDSDATVASLMTFLTLRPGDTDREYFANYTPAQLDFAEQHAEALANYCHGRFGE